jgi:hypothetical protein
MSRPARSRAVHGLAVVMLMTAAVFFIADWVRVSRVPKVIYAFDIYEYYFPNMVYAARSVWNAGPGFFWNALADCGEPFFGIGSTAVLYPANVLFLWLDPASALLALLVFNLTVAGVSGYALGRHLGLATLGALSLGMAFAYGPANVDLVTWSPLVGNAYAWFPAILLCCERILQQPTRGRGVALGAVLAVALLAGFPQQIMFIYQLIALRLAWALVTREAARPVSAATTIGLGLVLAPLLVAWPLVPSMESASLSVRSQALSQQEIIATGFLTMADFRYLVTLRADVYNPFRLLLLMLFAAGLLRTRTRRAGLFYLLAGLAFFDLCFGLNGHLFSLYKHLPGTTLFRDPARCMWIAALCLAVLTGLAVDAYVSDDPEPAPRLRAGLLVAIPVAGLAGFYALTTSHRLTAGEWWVAGVALAAVLVGRVPRFRLAAGVALTAALVVDLLLIRPAPFRRLLPDSTLLWAHADVFKWLRSQRTPQDRVYVVAEHADFSLMPKTPLLFGIPSVTNYEPQPSRRFSEFYVLMRSGRAMRSLNDYYFCQSSPRFKHRLLDLTGARYVVSSLPPEKMVGLPPETLTPAHEGGGVTVYENPTVLRRARYVPGLVVVPDPGMLLARLADGPDDPRAAALVEAPPASGFLGEPGPPVSGSVAFVTDDFEHLQLAVVAPRRGFVVLADQEIPGWRATVNDAPVEIIRANHAFRAVEVPAGTSVVDFRYAPTSVRIGGWVSSVTILALLAAVLISRSTRS